MIGLRRHSVVATVILAFCSTALRADHFFSIVARVAGHGRTIDTETDTECINSATGQEVPNAVILGAHGIFDLTNDHFRVYSYQADMVGGWYHFKAYLGLVEHCYYLKSTASRHSVPNNPCFASYAIAQTPCQDAVKQEETPIVLDLGADGFHLLGLGEGVTFDIDADGVAELTGWIGGDSNDALLARDLNGNGIIDDGSELFGSVTQLANGSTAENGYEALAELDSAEAGGDADGVLGPADAQWHDLLVWRDKDSDGYSDPRELMPLESAGILKIGFEVTFIGIQDEHGNEFRYSSWTLQRSQEGPPRPWVSYDVVFSAE
jgi:hypothetical protein